MRIARKRRKKNPSIKSNATAITAHHHHHQQHTRQSSGTQSNYKCEYVHTYDSCVDATPAYSGPFEYLFCCRVSISFAPTFIWILFDALPRAHKKRLFDAICFGWTFVLNDAHTVQRCSKKRVASVLYQRCTSSMIVHRQYGQRNGIQQRMQKLATFDRMKNHHNRVDLNQQQPPTRKSDTIHTHTHNIQMHCHCHWQWQRISKRK